MNLDIPSAQALGVVYRRLEKVDPKLSPDADLQIAERALLDSEADLNPILLGHDESRCIKITTFEDYRHKEVGRRLRVALKNLRYYRKLVRDCFAAYLSREHYSVIVRNHTRWKSAYVKVKPIRIVEVDVPKQDVYHLVHHSKTEWLSHSGFLNWKLSRCNRPKEIHKLSEAIHYLRQHPEKDQPHYREVLVSEWWTRDLLWPKGYFGKRRKYVRERKMIPVRDWNAIWQTWSVRRKRCLQRALPYLNKIGPLENEVAALRSVYYATPKRCYAYQNRFPITLGSKNRAVLDPTKCLQYTQSGQNMLWSLDYEEFPTYSSRTRAGLMAVSQLSKAEAYWGLPEIGSSEGDRGRLVYAPYRCAGSVSVERSVDGSEHVWSLRLPGVEGFSNPTRLATTVEQPIQITDHSKEHEDDAVLFRERRLKSFHKLMNLRCGSRASVFNVFRSGMEQKDLPQTHRTIQEFGLFCKSFQNGGIGGYRVVVGKRAYCVASNSVAWLRYAKVYAIRSWRERERAYRALGITSINPIRRKTLKTACALYLCWKFGIEQTLNDAQYLATETKKAKPFVRELLAQLRPNKFGVVTPRVRYAQPTHDHPLSRKKEEPYLEKTGRDATVVTSVEDHLDLSPIFEAICSGAWGSVSYPTILCTSDAGLPIPYPVTVDLSGGKAAVAEYNSAYCREFFEPWLRRFFKAQGLPTDSMEVHVDRIMRGSVLAQFGRRNLTRAMEPTLGNVMEFMRPLEVAWELAPLSFVVEWFTNIGQLTRMTQDMLSRVTTKLHPIGPVWETLRQDLYVAVENRRFKVTITLKPVAAPNVWFIGQTSRSTDPGKPENVVYTASGRLLPSSVHIIWEITEYSRATAQWDKPRRLTFTRRSWVGDEFELPPLDFRLNLNPGKLGSLLAIYLNQAL